MSKVFIMTMALTALVLAAPGARAQGGAKQGPAVTRDADLEKDSLHNLEVARHYFKLKKAYVAALERCESLPEGPAAAHSEHQQQGPGERIARRTAPATDLERAIGLSVGYQVKDHVVGIDALGAGTNRSVREQAQVGGVLLPQT